MDVLRGPVTPRVNASDDKAQAIHAAPANQAQTFFPPIGSPAFVSWAKHDSIGGHAANALQMLMPVLRIVEKFPANFDGEFIDCLRGVDRRLRAIVEVERTGGF